MENCLGVDVGGTKIHFYAKHAGEVFEKRGLTGFSYTREQLKADIVAFVASLSFPIHVVGVAVPAIVEDGVVTVSVDSLGLVGFCGTDFADQPYKVHVINDIRAATVEEQQYYPLDSTLAVMINGTGIAVGVVEKGTLLRGCRGYAGELGFIPMIDSDGTIRNAQDLMCGMGVLRMAGMDVKTFLDRLAAGDSEARQVIEKAAFYFGLGLATFITLFNPDHLVLGGSTCKYEGFRERAIAVAKEHSLECSFNACQFHLPHDYDRVVPLGAMRNALLIEKLI